MKSCLYFTNWSVYARLHFVNDIPPLLVTHIFYAFLGIDPDSGRLQLTDLWADCELPQKDSVSKGNIQALYNLKKANRNLKVCMSLGGWGTTDLFQAVVGDTTKLDTFVASVCEFIVEYGLAGVDIDWEYPETTTDAKNLALLLQKLRRGLDRISQSLLLTIATSASPDKIRILNIPAIDRYVSFYNVMCYDFAGGWSSNTGYHSNLYGNNGDCELNCDVGLNEFARCGLSDLQKVIVGMPNYGRSFTTDSPDVGNAFTEGRGHIIEEKGVFPYKVLPIGQEHVDMERVSASCYHPETKTLIVYDNPETTRIKAKYISQKGFGGGMRWASSDDNYVDKSRSLLWNFVEEIGELEYEENHLDLYDGSNYLNKKA